MGKKGSELDIEGEFQDENTQTLARIHLKIGNEKNEKTFLINKTKKRFFNYIQLVPPVGIFSPSFMYLIDGQPSQRRHFVDRILSKIDADYRHRLANYETGLRKRNKLIQKAPSMDELKDQLPFWDHYLVEQANYIVSQRLFFEKYFNDNKNVDNKSFSINYVSNEISFKTLAETMEKQFFLKKTLVGPQRDEFNIFLETGEEKKNIHKFGSRSEQRLSLLWMVMLEIKLYHDKLLRRPLLLLDDIFSELDIENRALILRLIKNHQTIITTTDKQIADLLEVPYSLIEL